MRKNYFLLVCMLLTMVTSLHAESYVCQESTEHSVTCSTTGENVIAQYSLSGEGQTVTFQSKWKKEGLGFLSFGDGKQTYFQESVDGSNWSTIATLSYNAENTYQTFTYTVSRTAKYVRLMTVYTVAKAGQGSRQIKDMQVTRARYIEDAGSYNVENFTYGSGADDVVKQSFTLSYSNAANPLTVTSSNVAFSASISSTSVGQAATTCTVDLTYNPSELGMHQSTITVTDGVVSYTKVVNGLCTTDYIWADSQYATFHALPVYWSPVNGVESYTIQMRDAANQVVTEQTLTNNYLMVTGLTPATNYTVRVCANYPGGYKSGYASAIIKTSDSIPTPKNFAVGTVFENTEVPVRWSNVDDVVTYSVRVYNAEGVLVDTKEGISDTVSTMPALDPNGSYTFRVRADYKGFVSDETEFSPRCVLTPSNLSAEITGKTELSISWTSTTADGYEFVVLDDEGNEIASVAGLTESPYVVTDLHSGATYTIKLRGTTDDGATPYIDLSAETWKLLPSDVTLSETDKYFAQPVAWAAVEEADAYRMQLLDKEGNVLRDSVITEALELMLEELVPADYTVKVAPQWSGYTFAYNTMDFSIAKAPLTITALDTTRVYAAADPEFALTYEGWIENHDTVDVAPTVVPESAIDSPAGEYALNLDGGNDAWYEYNFVSGKLTITKSDLHVSVADTLRAYHTEDPEFKLIYDGFLLDDDASILQQEPIASTEADLESPIGSKWAINLSGGESDRYNFVFPEVPDSMTVLQAYTSISTDTIIKKYGDEPFALATNNVDKPLVYAIADTEVAEVVEGKIVVRKLGHTTITVTQEGSDNFFPLDSTYIPLVVEKAPLTVTALDTARLYGEPNPEFRLTYEGFVNGEGSEVITETPVASTEATTESLVGTYTINVTGGITQNYEFVYVPGTLTINPLQTNMTVQTPDTVTYGDAPVSLPVVKTNNTAGEIFYTIADTTIARILPDTTIAILAAGTTWINIEQTSGGSFTAVTDSVAFVVKKAHLTVAVADTSRAYGEANPDFKLIYSGFVNGDTDSVIIEAPIAVSEAVADSDFGDYPITISGGKALNYDFVYTEGALLSINTAATIIPTDTIAAVYGDSIIVIPTNNNEGAIHCNVVDTTIARFADGRLTVVGAGETILQVWQDSSKHYTSQYTDSTFVEVPLVIAKTPLIITALDTTRRYLDANPEITFAYDGFVYGEDTAALAALPVAIIEADDSTTVGNYVINVDSATAANYDITFVAGTLHIIPAISILDVVAVDTLIYGAEPFALPEALKNNVERDLVYTTLDSTVAVVRDSVVTVCGVGTTSLVVSQEAGDNYTAVSDTVEIVVEKALITISVADTARVYGVANPEMEFIYDGFVYNEDTAALAVKPVIVWEAADTTSTGVYAITPQGAEARNYEFAYNAGKLTINPATTVLSVVTPDTVVYGSEAAALQMTTNNTESEVMYSVTDPSVVEVVDGKFIPKRVGTTYVVAMQLASRNYTQAMTNFFTYTVSKAPLSISVVDTTRVYGEENPQFDIIYNGFVNGDTEEALTVKPVVVTDADTTSNVGIYTITVSGAEAVNYDITYADAVLEITPATALLTVDEPDTMVYGDAPMAIDIKTNNTESELTYVVEDTRVVKVEDGKLVIVAPGKTTVTVAQAESNNYIAAAAVTVPVVVNKAPLSVRVADVSRAYGDENPEFVISYDGFVNGETADNLTAKAVATCAATQSSVGTFPIVVSSAVSANYEFTYHNGTLTIGAVASNLVVDQIPTKTYGDLPFALPVVSSNNNRGEITYAIADEDVAEIKNGRIYIKRAGKTTLVVSQAATEAYSAAEQRVEIIVEKALITVTADDVTINTGDAVPQFTLSYKGFILGENVASIATLPVASCDITDTSVAGKYDITVSGAEDENYDFEYVSGTLTINEVSGINAADTDEVHIYIASGNLYIIGNVDEVTLYNMSGAAVKRIVAPASCESVAELNVGNYIVVARVDNDLKKFRVVKK